ncbi:MAG: protein-disulfide reductase DsbD family protein [Porticoccaceae bacterium]|tara:strand:- start:2890 stop:4647 length:1758 start_codon:yes stop_codon:yes gene_type:complete
MKQLLKALLLMTFFLVSSTQASSLSAVSAAGSFSPVTKASTELKNSAPVFLPVQQAFQVDVFLDGQNLSLNWSIADDYYLYRKGFKLSSLSNSTQVGTPIFSDGILKWDEYFEAEVVVYYDKTSFEVPFSSQETQFQLQLESQGCANAGLCYPPRKQILTIDLTAGTVAITEPTIKALKPDSVDNIASTPLGLILLFALVGGLILNLMPCVFPVLSIKVLSFTQQHQTISERQRHGVAYTAGVVSSFVAIAAIMLSLRAGGEAIGWGFQLQSPSFVLFLVYLFILLGLSLSGYMQLFSGLMSVGQSSNTHNGLGSSFMTGVLATTVASPCTAPFMGPALGFAISQTSLVALLVFAFLGLGMALPFVALTLIPSLTQKLPKPGQWMDNLKQFLAFPMYLTAIWLLWVVGRQTGIEIVIAICVGLVLMVMAIWFWQLAAKNSPSTFNTLIKLVAIGLFISAIAYPSTKLENNDQPRWQDYSPQRLSELRQSGQAVFVNLTADWCITCLVNERIAMGEGFYQALEDNNISYLKGDWTHKDPEITALLNQYNRNGVPLYLLFAKDSGSAEILPQFLTTAILIEALESVN